MKKILIALSFCFACISLQAQNVINVHVRHDTVTRPNYVIGSSYEPLSADVMMAAARAGANRFAEYSKKAYAALRKGDKAGFITYTNYALSTDFYNAKMYYDRGNVFRDLGDYKQAKKEYKKAKKHGYYQANQALDELKELTKKKR